MLTTANNPAFFLSLFLFYFFFFLFSSLMAGSIIRSITQEELNHFALRGVVLRPFHLLRAELYKKFNLNSLLCELTVAGWAIHLHKRWEEMCNFLLPNNLETFEVINQLSFALYYPDLMLIVSFLLILICSMSFELEGIRIGHIDKSYYLRKK